MSMLASALAWAARGFPVFPIAEGTKDQPLVDEFYAAATCDQATITAWWRDPLTGAERNHNIGVSTTGLVVVDVDVKGGKHGFASYIENEGHFDTLIVKTPSGGRHAYYHGPHAQGRQGVLGKDSGLDIRSWHNYVLAPGSATAEGTYSVEVDLPLAEIPAGLRVHLRAPQERQQGDTVDITETTSSVDRAITFLLQTPAAVEGAGGDNQTFMTAARLRDLGINETTAYDLMATYYNPRCAPVWDVIELKAKVANAYAYGTAPFGIMAPETHYAALSIPEGPSSVEPERAAPAGDVFVFGNALDPFLLPPRPWLYGNMLMRSNVTTFVGASTAGKSLMQLIIAAHLALGKDVHGSKLRNARPMKSIIYNGEDDLEEQTRRLYAICLHYNFDWPTVRDAIALVGKKTLRLQVATADNWGKPEVNYEDVNKLVRAAADPDVAFISLDAMVQIHQSDEQDNPAMRYVVEACAKIGEVTNTAVAIVHHVAKPSAASKIGEMYAARGASEIINAARVGINLTTPSAADLASGRWPIPPEEGNRFVAMADAKLNYGLSGSVKWWRKVGIRIPSGDEIGVLAPYDMDVLVSQQTNAYGLSVAAAMKDKGQATMLLAEAGEVLQLGDALLSKMKPAELRVKLKSIFTEPIETALGTIRTEQEQHGARWDTRLVLE